MIKLKILAAVGAATLMTTGAMVTAASAQPYRDYDRHESYGDRRHDGYAHRGHDARFTSSYVDSLEWKINNAAQERRISWGHARQLVRELRQVQGPLVHRVETGQASNWEVRRLSTTVNRIEMATQTYANGRRYERYGYNRF